AVLAPRRALRRAPSLHRDVAAAEERLQRRVDLRELGIPGDGGVAREARLEVPAAARTARQEAEEDVRERHRAEYIKIDIPRWITVEIAVQFRWERNATGSL